MALNELRDLFEEHSNDNVACAKLLLEHGLDPDDISDSKKIRTLCGETMSNKAHRRSLKRQGTKHDTQKIKAQQAVSQRFRRIHEQYKKMKKDFQIGDMVAVEARARASRAITASKRTSAPESPLVHGELQRLRGLGRFESIS